MMSSTAHEKHALVVEDDPEFQLSIADALATLTGPWRIDSFTLGEGAISFSRSSAGRQPNVALVDLGLPDMDGLQVIAHLHLQYPSLPILVLSVLTSEEKVVSALQLGASGYVLKHDDAMEIATAIEQTMQGNHPISPRLARYLIRAIGRSDGQSPREWNISTREEELLKHIALGRSYAEAATAMCVKTSTVHSYSKSLFKKLGVKSKTQAIAFARRRGFLIS